MTFDASQPAERRWRLDKSIPLALVLSILLQTAVAVWWASGINGRVAQLELSQAAIAKTLETGDKTDKDQEGRIIRLETIAQGLRDTLAEMKVTLTDMNRKLDRDRTP